MKKEERLSAIEIALKNEMTEREFYLKNARRTKNPLGKAMFKQIADDELEHYERLKELHKTWKKQGKWPASLPLTVKGTAVRDVLKAIVKKVDQAPPGDDDDLKAIRVALDFEAKGEKYYAKLRDASTESSEKSFFDLLSKIEREHYLSLKDTEEFYVSPDSWYRKKEHLMVDGG
ncbi:MAG TPA: ferritin family protein [Syntrophales bacterium]|jgi:rubrerythrin|nr:ferritin family protein [Syntrophales bacterium]HOX93765.1 ferritin family protein [Syntrophales bacterium]HPI55906.1 ferritin family protein [Syntrophales bacterium]HPN23603.1 ferritin family protein [Syntrophales bacterium]HQM27872.1 ferritin family protein [Syntrophales bacterium]